MTRFLPLYKRGNRETFVSLLVASHSFYYKGYEYTMTALMSRSRHQYQLISQLLINYDDVFCPKASGARLAKLTSKYTATPAVNSSLAE